MDGLGVGALVCGLVLGLLIGVAAALVIARSRREVLAATDRTEVAQLRAELANAHTATATARGEAERFRAETAQVRGELEHARANQADTRADTADQLALARTDAANARTEAATAQAEAAEVSAAVAKVTAERDAARQRATEIEADREAMLNHFKVLSAETLERQGRTADASAEQRLKATEQLMLPVRQSLDRFNDRLTEVEKERVAISTDLKAQVQSVQLTGETLRRETSALITALRKPQVRGAWGETQLKRVAELAGMVERCDFDLQQTTRADDRTLRPDMRVNLAQGKHIFVDSKVPLSSFLEAAETDDPEVKAEALARYGRHVRTHVDQLSSKQYWKAAETPEFVVLFLPNEMFFATALDQVPDLYDYAAQRDVVLATPTTLIGMLRAVAYGWKQAALAESAAEVFKLGRDLHERLGLMGNRFDKLGRALRTSVNAYNETIATVEGTVLVQARKFRDLKVSEKELESLTPVHEPVRQIQAVELVEDAVQVEPLVGRSKKRRLAIPEAAELVRPEPDLLELVESTVPDQNVPGEDERQGRAMT
ncbi:DNA recombination protein RmuC [uncultured Friedmanniella sp.]|uniref:DNA recombination protein RmuC n=1 Tax=uncultured Friedmanniella sp. TaxID=335381 RepID=UPI0035CA4DFE